MSIWAKLNHPNILPLLGYMFEKDYPSLISEWMEHGTVRDFLRKNPPFDITYLVCAFFFPPCSIILNVAYALKALGIAKGLEYIHEQNVVHSDMKAVSGSPRSIAR